MLPASDKINSTQQSELDLDSIQIDKLEKAKDNQFSDDVNVHDDSDHLNPSNRGSNSFINPMNLTMNQFKTQNMGQKLSKYDKV